MIRCRSCRHFSHAIVTTAMTKMASSMARTATVVASPGLSGHPVSVFSLTRSTPGSAVCRATALGKAMASPAIAALAWCRCQHFHATHPVMARIIIMAKMVTKPKPPPKLPTENHGVSLATSYLSVARLTLVAMSTLCFCIFLTSACIGILVLRSPSIFSKSCLIWSGIGSFSRTVGASSCIISVTFNSGDPTH